MTFATYRNDATFGTWHEITGEYVLASQIPNPLPDGVTIAEHPKGTNYDFPTAAPVGWFVDVDNVFAVAESLPSAASSSAAAQRAEIRDIARQFLAAFTAIHFGTTEATRVRKYARNAVVYADASTTNTQLDKVKTVLRVEADDLALYSDSTWDTGLDTVGLRAFVKPDALTPNSVAYPAAETGMPTVQASALTGANLAALL